ncbi:MAG: type II toxin-antitoxin system HicA family toxin [Candidatus Micrarchaeia archaeon]
MDVEEHEPILRRMRLGALEPGLRREVVDVAIELGHESAITSDTKLHFLLKIYLSEKAREKGREESLRKAEDLIMRLSSLHYEAHRQEMERRKSQRKSAPVRWSGSEIPISGRTKELLESIGITDEKAMAGIVEVIGDEKVAERVGLVHISDLGADLTKKLFSAKPEMMLTARDDDFIMAIETLETKRSMIDSALPAAPPVEPLYHRIPEVMFEDYHDLATLLDLKPPEQQPEPAVLEEEKKQKLRVSPITPDDFIKVLRGFGFAMKSGGPHRVLTNDEGMVAVVQSGHGSNKEFGPGLVRMKVRDIGLSIEDFEKKRKELGL